MNATPSRTQLRVELQAAVLADLLGPAGGPTEVVPERSVRDRYLLGLLAPKGQSSLPEQNDDPAEGGADGEDGVTDAPPPKAATMLPSSLGLTFTVVDTVRALRITARWGRYDPGQDENFKDKDGTYRRVWRRTPVEATTVVAINPGPLPEWPPYADQPEVVVQGLVRPGHGQHTITLFLVNGQEEPKRFKDTAWLFQPELVVESEDGSPVFQKRPLAQPPDPEERSLAMLYRHSVEFAVGHNIAVAADIAESDAHKAVRLRTVVVPECEVRPTTWPAAEQYPALTYLPLDMKKLAEIADGQFMPTISPLLTAYATWIAGIEQQVAHPEPELEPYSDVARLAVANCQEALSRIRAGIELLDRDANAALAFRFANRAMCLQRFHSDYAAAVRRGEAPDPVTLDVPERHSWRLFQLAFILLNLPSLTDLAHPERTGSPAEMVADLLWFPTGGGKTEAYLGLSAYAMAIRRLQGEVGGRSGAAGIAVLMRYTLRLLTLQQFQRAAALMCACEVIRRENPAIWGSEPFRIGLWVGRHTTPNSTADSAEAVTWLRRDLSSRGEGSPHQLTNCPWCGAPIDPGQHIIVESFARRGRTFIYCGDPLGRCPFSQAQSPGEGLPILVVDEEIYRRLPALLIATVDKFAQMPWNGRTAMLFGQVNGYCPRHGFRSPQLADTDYHQRRGALPAVRTVPAMPLRPPDLIIQDELHLISGPLGTLVGLYETAIDHLASWEVDGRRVYPKVIASTATVRRADSQVHNLFLRRVKVFPPQGLDASDNFFSHQSEPSDGLPGRLYVGVCAPGIRFRTALMRTYVAFLSAAQKLYNQYGAAADPWMTLVGYFNSLRELGGMRRSVDDSVSSRLREMDHWGLAPRYLDFRGVEELTSRLTATDIPQILDRLETEFPDPSSARSGRKKYPVDVLLATNMISVGVDVSRLGLMVVAGQPKTTAEYIQATSRVGRRYPGLVAIVYNWTRPRDLSHYERFAHYHGTFYQHVEALSVTPFAARALDRGLTGVLVALIRLLGLDLNDNDKADSVSREHQYIRAAIEQLAHRTANVAGPDVEALVRKQLAVRLDEWLNNIDALVPPARLRYQKQNDQVTVPLLEPAGISAWGRFTCLNSLRDVEPPVPLILNDFGMDRAVDQAWVPMPKKEKKAEEETGTEEAEGDE